MPCRCKIFAVPAVARISKPSCSNLLTGRSICGLSRSATEMNIRPEVGSALPAAACDLANALGKSTSIPITSPVDRISGPKSESTYLPSLVAKRLNGSTASLTEIVEPADVVVASIAGRSPAS